MADAVEPNPKRRQNSSDSDVIICYTYTLEGGKDDRILDVDGESFYVQSDRLLEVSEYFRVLFTGPFKEANEKEIKLPAVKKEKFRTYLDAVYKPSKVYITDETVKTLLELSVFFQSDEFIVNFFKEKDVCKEIKEEKLLEYANIYGNLLMNNFLDEYLADKYISSPRHFPFSDRASFSLIKDYNLPKLLAAIIQNILKSLRHYDFERIEKNLDYAKRYELILFTDKLQTFLINGVGAEYARRYIERMLEFSADFDLPRLKGFVEQFLIDLTEKNERTLDDLKEYEKLTRIYDLQALNKAIEISAINKFNDEKVNFDRYLDLVATEKFPDLKKAVEDHLIGTIDYVEHTFYLVRKYDFRHLKKVMSDFFAERVVGYSRDELLELCKNIKDHKFHDLKKKIDEKLTEAFLEQPNFNTLEACLQYDLRNLKEAIKEHLSHCNVSSEFIQDNKNLIQAFPAYPKAFIFECMLFGPQ